MPYHYQMPRRKWIRLKGYDYSREGMYFLTVCIQNRLHLLGKIENEKMILNAAGKMVEKWYFELENKYPGIKCREYIVMPNHFHCIIEITGKNRVANAPDAHGGTSLRGHPERNNIKNDKSQYGPENKKYGASIFDIMDWFKTMTTNDYIRGVKNKKWMRFEKRFWQLKYWDHIIRDENDYFRILNYIKNNPRKWGEDKFNNPE